MGHHIADMEILVMTDRRKHRDRILRDNRSKFIIIKTCQVQLRTASSKNKHRIISAALRSGCALLHSIQHGIQSRNYGRRTIRTLHERREKHRLDLEPVRIFLYVAHEVTITCGILCRNHGKTIWNKRKFQLLLKIHQTFLLKALDGPLSLLLLLSERELRIDVINYQRHAIQLTIIDLHLNKNDQSLLQRSTGHRFEIRSDEAILRAPDYCRGFCYKSLLITLRQLQITMASATRLDSTHFGPYPYAVRKKRFYPLFQSML